MMKRMKLYSLVVFTGILLMILSKLETIIIRVISFVVTYSTTAGSGWDSEGINTSFANNSFVRCYSSHLTSFAVLVTVVDKDSTTAITNGTAEAPTGIEEHLLSIFSYIGCSISIVCLLMTVMCLLTLK